MMQPQHWGVAMGYFRFFLALLVMHGHLAGHFSLGREVVVIFYLLSGYGSAGSFAKKDRVTFLADRIWRLYPIYLAAFLFFLVMFSLVETPFSIGIPALPERLWQSLMIVVVTLNSPHQYVISEAFFLTNLLVCYGLMALRAFATSQRTLAVVMGTVLVSGWVYKSEPFAAWYLSPLFGIALFSLGVLAFHQGWQIPMSKGRGAVAESIAYPLYLTHSGIGVLLSVALEMPYSYALFLAALPPTLALSWLLVVAVARPIARYRKKFQSPSTEN